MEKNSKIKILNIMSGAKTGGAERFFERLVIAIEKENIEQKVIIKHHSPRVKLLKDKIANLETIKIFNNYNPFCLFFIERIIKNFKPNIILSWMNRASGIIPNEKIGNEVNVGRLGGFYKLKNYKNCDYLIANTQEIKNYIINSGWDSKKVFLIPNFVNSNNNEKKKLIFHKNETLLAMGRFHENKGFDILIKSMTFLPDYKLLLVGNGSLKDHYINLINTLNLKNRIKIYEWTDNISSFLNSSSMLICPSRHEPFGNIIIDAWAHHVPVISSDIGGPNKLIKDKINGLKFEKNNVFNLVKKIKEISNNEKLKKKIINNAYHEYNSRFTEKKIIKEYISFFRKIVK